MRNVIRRTLDSIDLIRTSLAGRDHAGWHGLLLITTGWVGIGIAFAFAGGSVLLTAVLAIASLAAVGRGAAICVAVAASPTRYVFKSRPCLWAAALLLGTAAITLVVFIKRTPFDRMLAFGKPLPNLIAELTFVAAMAVCLVAGSVALHKASQARHAERNWS